MQTLILTTLLLSYVFVFNYMIKSFRVFNHFEQVKKEVNFPNNDLFSELYLQLLRDKIDTLVFFRLLPLMAFVVFLHIIGGY